MVKLCVLIILFGVVGLSEPADLKNHDVRIFIADDSELTHQIAEALQHTFPSAQVVNAVTKQVSNRRKTVYVTVGPSALRALAAQGIDDPIVSTFTSSQVYKAITESASEARPQSITAIYADPSPAKQIRLISLLFKKQTRIAALLSDKTKYMQPVLRQAAEVEKLNISIEQISAEDTLNRALNRIADFPALLAIPDNTIYNAENIRSILVTTYRHNQVVIGYSTAMVKAGALASTYSDVDSIIAQVDEILGDYDVTGKLPEPQFPKYFSVVINEDVARSLNFVIDDSIRNFGQKPKVRK